MSVTTGSIYYRLVIDLPGSQWLPGNAFTGHELVYTSSGSNTWNYIVEPPTGDGEEINPITGEYSYGSYKVKIVDAPISGSNRVVTGQLADQFGKSQLLLRPAFLQYSNNGVQWNGLSCGYITQIQLTDTITFEFTVGESRQIEQTYKPFDSIYTSSYNGSGWIPNTGSAYFSQRPCFFPPRTVIGGFGPLSDIGGANCSVVHVTTGPVTAISFQWSTQGRTFPYVVTPQGGQPANSKGGQPIGNQPSLNPSDVANFVNPLLLPAWQPFSPPATNWQFGQYLNYYAILFEINATNIFTLPWYSLDSTAGQFGSLANSTAITPGGFFTLGWDTSILGAAPTVGRSFIIYGFYGGPASENNPVYLQEHPVDLATTLYNSVPGITYDTGSAAAIKSQMSFGQTNKLALRMTDNSQTLDSFLQDDLFGPFGFNARLNSSGSRTFINTRMRLNVLPTESISINDLKNDSGIIYSLDDANMYNSVVVQQEGYVLWQTGMTTSEPSDNLVAYTDIVNNSSAEVTASGYGIRQLTYTIPGGIMSGQYITGSWTGSVMASDQFTTFANGLAYEVFDRALRGVIITEGNLLTEIASNLGDFLLVSMSYMPNALVGQNPTSQRGNVRVMQIVKRTETPTGPSITLWDAGVGEQIPGTPSMSLATGSVDSRKFFTMTIANSGSITANLLNLRVETGAGTLAPSGGLATVYAYNNIPSIIYPPVQSAGPLIWVRARLEDSVWANGSMTPGGWCSWESVQLTPLNPVSNLSVSVGSYPCLATWTLGEIDMPIEIWMSPASGSSNGIGGPAIPLAGATLIATMPVGSTQDYLTTLPDWAYTLYVRHVEPPPYNGVSPWTVTYFTSSIASTPSQPTNPTTGNSSGPGALITWRPPPSLLNRI